MGTNSLLRFFRQQQGFSYDLNYDFALCRLRVCKEDCWKGIAPSYYSSDFNPEPPIFAAKFAQCSNYTHILALASEDGKIALQNTTKRNKSLFEKSLEGQQCHFNAVFDVAWDPGQMKLVSASGDHTARLWDVTESCLQGCRVFKGHIRSVKTAVFRRDDSAVFATGGRDGAIVIWDTRATCCTYLTPRADNCIYQGHPGPTTGTSSSSRKRNKFFPNNSIASSITGLVFQDDNTLISCGAGDGIIKVWDLRRNYTAFKGEPLPKYSLPHQGSSTFKGFTNLLIDNCGKKLYANCMDNTIYCYNLSSYSSIPYAKYKGLRNNTFYIKSCLSPDGQYLISGSSDENAYIWNIKNTKSSLPLIKLNGHNVEVTCVAWTEAYGDICIATCSDDAKHKLWRIGPDTCTDKFYYRGSAEFYKNLYEKSLCSQEEYEEETKTLNCFTPRSMHTLVKLNEKTPCSSKRTFSEMNNGEAGCSNNNSKRSMMTGRTLFTTPHGKKTNELFSTKRNEDEEYENDNEEEGKNNCNAVIEFQHNRGRQFIKSNNKLAINCDPNNIIMHNSMLTPLIENEIPPQLSPSSSHSHKQEYPTTSAPSLSSHSYKQEYPTTASVSAPLSPSSNSNTTPFSPTSNLPNYVLDGEAPHLHVMSPKRKKENIDWLTRIRKRKLSSVTSGRLATLKEKLEITCNDENNMIPVTSTPTTSPLIHDLRVHGDINNSGGSNRSKFHGNPKSRISSRSGSTDIHHNNSNHHKTSIQRTPTSRRRNSETSILRYLTPVSSPSTSSSLQMQQ